MNPAPQLSFAELHDLYRDLLLNNLVPYWLKHAIDRDLGGLFTCIRDDGSKISTNKFMWSQCRAVWTFAALYNRIEQRPEFLEIARATAEFILRHGRDEHGWYFYEVTREGQPVQGPVSASTDFFAAYGLGELYRATREERFLREALQALRNVVARTRDPRFNTLAPYTWPEGVGKVHGVAMLGLETAQELADVAPEPDLLQLIDECLCQIMDHHVRPARKLVLEHLGPNHEELDTPPGRAVVPGHTIESMWFVLHQARRRKDAELVKRAVEVIRWALELGWDQKKGGMVLAVDAAGGTPWWKHAEKKLWWPHGEALYALLLAYELTREPWCLDWYWKLHDWSFSHFPDHEHGEWHQKLDHEGEVITEVIALPVKDPFHLPRNAMLAIDVLRRLRRA